MTKPCENPGKNRTRTRANRAGVKHTVAEHVAEFTAYLKALKRAKATIYGYTHGLDVFFDFLDEHGITDFRSVTRQHIRTYTAELMESGRWKPEAVHLKLRAVRRFYDYLEANGKVLVNPALGVPMPALGDRLPAVILTKAEVRRLLDAPDTSKLVGIRDKAMLEVFYSAGLRLAELCSLTVYDVDTQSGFVRVNSGKGGKDRVVPLGRKATRYVTEYLRHVRGRFTEKNRDERTLFVGHYLGRGINPLIVGRLVGKYARAAGITKNVSPHTLRHTCATHMIADGADVVHVQRLLGHADISTTQIYTRVARREVKDTHKKTHPRERQRAAVPRRVPRGPASFKGPWRRNKS